MTEETIRATIRKLWRNHPEGAATFSECSVDGCKRAARDGLCDEHIVLSLGADSATEARLFEIDFHIKKIRSLESDIMELAEEG